VTGRRSSFRRRFLLAPLLSSGLSATREGGELGGVVGQLYILLYSCGSKLVVVSCGWAALIQRRLGLLLLRLLMDVFSGDGDGASAVKRVRCVCSPPLAFGWELFCAVVVSSWGTAMDALSARLSTLMIVLDSIFLCHRRRRWVLMVRFPYGPLAA